MIVLAKVCKGVDTILKDYEGSYSKKSNISREALTFLNPEVLSSAVSGHLLGHYIDYPIWLSQILFYRHV